jgi:hypothetical protein
MLTIAALLKMHVAHGQAGHRQMEINAIIADVGRELTPYRKRIRNIPDIYRRSAF